MSFLFFDLSDFFSIFPNEAANPRAQHAKRVGRMNAHFREIPRTGREEYLVNAVFPYCEQPEKYCPPPGVCTMLPKGYHCECPRGLIFDYNALKCVGEWTASLSSDTNSLRRRSVRR